MMVKIRKFKPEDAEAVFKIRANSVKNDFTDELDPGIIQDLISAYTPGDYIRAAEKNDIFVAEERSEIVGFLYIGLTEDETKFEIKLIYVAPSYRGKGIGTQFIRLAEEYAKKNHPNIKTLMAATAMPKATTKFYENMGFKEVGWKTYMVNKSPIKALYFEKNY